MFLMPGTVPQRARINHQGRSPLREGLRKLSGLNRVASEQFQDGLVEITTSVIEAELSLLEVKIERMFRHTIELRQPPLGVAPEALDAVDVRTVVGCYGSILLRD